MPGIDFLDSDMEKKNYSTYHFLSRKQIEAPEEHKNNTCHEDIIPNISNEETDQPIGNYG